MAVEIFDNVEFTSIEMFMNGIDNTGNSIIFFFLPLDLISQRRLIGYTFSASYVVTGTRRPITWADAQITISKPLNQSRAPLLSSTSPINGALTSTTTEIHLQGNGGSFSIVPVDITEFRLVVELSDSNFTNNPVTANLALMWDRPRVKKLKFIGD